MARLQYTYKYPRTSWTDVRETLSARKRRYWYSLEAAVRDIERMMRPGCTKEPFVQLIEVPPDGPMRVLAERTQDEWLGTLEAAGFIARRVS